MTAKVVVVTAPDDVLIDGFRLLLVDLNAEQTKIISDSLLKLKSQHDIITYLWSSDHDTDWLLEKKSKSNLIIFNADSTNSLVVGYICAQKNSHYFGTLRNLSRANAKAIYASEDCESLLNLTIENYE